MDLFPEHKSKLIKDTTREERERLFGDDPMDAGY